MSGPAFHRLGQQVGAQASRQRCRQRIVEKQPHMAAAPGPRSLESRRDAQAVARSQERRGVVLPPSLIEVDREEEARLIEQQRVDARDERLPFGIPSRQVPADDVVGDWKETAIGALRALDPWLLADAPHPLIGAGGCVPAFAGLAALESPRIDVRSTAKERTEEGNLFVRR